jgi:K319L-like, PKD domain/SdiA-regulated
MAGTRTENRTRTATSALVLGAALLVPVAGATATSATAAPAASAPRGSAPPASATAAENRPKAFEKRPFYTRQLGLAHPTGATFLDGPRVLAIAQAEPRATAIRLLDPRSEKVVGRVSLKARIAPSTLADNGRGRLAALAGRTFVTWKANARGTVRPARRTVTGASVAKVRSMTYDPQTRSWLGLDAARSRLVTLRAKGHSMRAVATGRVAGLAGHTPVGVAYDPATRRVYVADPVASKLVPVGPTGKQVAPALDISGVPTTRLRSLAFGATADPTDTSKATSLYATDSGANATLGKVAEISLAPIGQAAAAAPLTSTATLVKKTDLSKISPPSPDTSGIVYMRDTNRLFIVDSEVDEMTIYKNVNMWQLSLDGSSVFTTGNTLKFSKEPTGVGYDPDKKVMFISDDDKKRVFSLKAGTDAKFGTADDPTTTSISASAFGDSDSEDVTFDTKGKDLYVTDGTGLEVWRVAAGPNGSFDGIAPTGDDVVTHFDVGVYGITDLEGMGYSETRDSLFLMDRNFKKIVEVTKTGALVQTIDITNIGMNKPAAIAIGPASNDSSRTDLYVTVRGVDNDSHPDENDGAMYELSAPNLGPTGPQTNAAPSVSAGSDQTITLPSSASLNGTVTDDGLPTDGTLTSTWSKVSGPGTVSFGSATSADTSATFSVAGTYVLRLTGSDTALSSADDVTVTVNPASGGGGTNSAPTVTASADQTITLPSTASLSASVVDDGLPNGSTTVTWSKTSGPGTVGFSPATGTSTTATFSTAGAYVVRATASDGALTGFDEINVTVQPQPGGGGTNLVGNAGFETATTGWKASTGALTRVAAPHTGSWAGAMTNTGSSSVTCQLNDSPNWVASTTAGTYTATAWVKSDAAGNGSTVRLRFREYDSSGTNLGSKESTIVLNTSYQSVTLSYTPTTAGSTLDFNVLRSSTPAGALCYHVDDISIVKN